MNPHPAPYADHSRSLLAAAARHQSQADALSAIGEDVRYGLRQFTDSFMAAVSGDFLAETDEQRLHERHRPQAAALLRARNQRCRLAQHALHGLYAKLCAGTPMSIEERALAEHAQDLCEAHAQRETERRGYAL
jgi:hypothetical protein